LIVSEYAPGVEPAPWRFPARNRIVAGLTLATVVIEARERSGALITADLALDEGREVLAVPGEITSQLSRGTNHLLRLGAVPVTCAADVLRVLGVDPPPARDPPVLDPRLELVRATVADAAATADEVAQATGQSARVVAAALAELELLGVVEEADGVYRAVVRA
jgi:DNA processing protein